MKRKVKEQEYRTPKACYKKAPVRKLTKQERANDIEQERLDRPNCEYPLRFKQISGRRGG